MTPEDLRLIGVALYGGRWRAGLAEHLDVGERLLNRWLAGTAPIPDGVLAELKAEMQRVADELSTILTRLS